MTTYTTEQAEEILAKAKPLQRECKECNQVIQYAKSNKLRMKLTLDPLRIHFMAYEPNQME